MKKKQTFLLTATVTAALSLTGCQSGSADAHNEELRQQISQLEQQIQDLEEQITSVNEAASKDSSAAQNTPADQSPQETAPAANPDPEAEAPPEDTSSLSTTYTMEELNALVSAYEEKADSAVPSGSASEDMEQFFALKQEEKSIDDTLDLHEDELEYLYRNNQLSRDEYKTLERELDRLEDRLDAAEDKLEYTFGIDD